MNPPTLCIIFEAIGPYNAIGRVAMNDVRIALAAGYKVTVVAKRLHESLHAQVEWLKLYVPPRFFYLQWVTARHFMQRALGGRTFDIIHAHQPQAAAMSDVFQCHFLTRMSYERNCFPNGPGLRAKFMRAQELGVLKAEDACYRQWNPNTRMLFGSHLTRSDFIRIYGKPPREDVLVLPMPPLNIPTEEECRSARQALIGPAHQGPVLGFLGGGNERKGCRRLIEGLIGDNDIFLLMGGAQCDGLEAPSLRGRFKTLGLVENTAQFYAACDVFIVPSLYEPLGLVAFEAAARGVPVIATSEVGALPHLLEYGMGAEWRSGTGLGSLIRELASRRPAMEGNARRMAEELSEARYGEKLPKVYEDVMRKKRG